MFCGWSSCSGLFGGVHQQHRAHLVPHGGGTGSYSEALTDPAEVEYVIQLVAQYKEDISARKVLLAFPGI